MKLRMYLRGLGLGLVVAAVVLSFNNSNKEPMTDSEIIAKAKALGMEEKKATLAEELPNPGIVSDEPENVGAALDKTENKQEDKAGSVADDNDEVKALDVKSKDDAKPQEDAKPETAESNEETNSENNRPEESKNNEASKPENTKPDEAVKEDVKPEKNSSEDSKDSKKAEPDKNNPENNNKAEADKTDTKAEAESKPEEKAPAKKNSKTTITVSSGVSSETVAKLLEKGGVIDSAAKFDKYLCDKDYDNKIATGTHEIPEGATYEEIARILTNR